MIMELPPRVDVAFTPPQPGPTNGSNLANRKLRKKRRDPQAPKRASNAYMIFCKERRATLKVEHPELAFGKLGQMLGDIWRKLSADEKRPYEQRAQGDRDRYKKEMGNYAEVSPSAANNNNNNNMGKPKTKKKDEGDESAARLMINNALNGAQGPSPQIQPSSASSQGQGAIGAQQQVGANIPAVAQANSMAVKVEGAKAHPVANDAHHDDEDDDEDDDLDDEDDDDLDEGDEGLSDEP